MSERESDMNRKGKDMEVDESVGDTTTDIVVKRTDGIDTTSDRAMVPSDDQTTNPTELAERDMAMMRQFLEAMQNKHVVNENIRNTSSVNTNNNFLTGIVRDFKVFRGAIDVARQEKIDALKMVTHYVEKTKRAQEMTTAELNRVLVQQQHLLKMLRELRESGGEVTKT